MRIVDEVLAVADVVKASDQDLAWLAPDRSIAEVAADWVSRGPALVVVTRGGTARTRWAPVPGRSTGRGSRWTWSTRWARATRSWVRWWPVCTGATCSVPRSRRTAVLPADEVEALVDEAIEVSAITCSRQGADPPTAAEIRSGTVAELTPELLGAVGGGRRGATARPPTWPGCSPRRRVPLKPYADHYWPAGHAALGPRRSRPTSASRWSHVVVGRSGATGVARGGGPLRGSGGSGVPRPVGGHLTATAGRAVRGVASSSLARPDPGSPSCRWSGTRRTCRPSHGPRSAIKRLERRGLPVACGSADG